MLHSSFLLHQFHPRHVLLLNFVFSDFDRRLSQISKQRTLLRQRNLFLQTLHSLCLQRFPPPTLLTPSVPTEILHHRVCAACVCVYLTCPCGSVIPHRLAQAVYAGTPNLPPAAKGYKIKTNTMAAPFKQVTVPLRPLKLSSLCGAPRVI